MATRGSWSGKWYASYAEYDITKILGVTESGTKDYWEIFVDNVSASSGACEIALRSGEQVLFAAVPSSGSPEYPLGVKLPGAAVAGRAFTAKVVYYNAKGKAVPLAGAAVSAGSSSGTTNASGAVRLTVAHTGTFTVRAGAKGYIRDEAKLRVTASA